MARIGFDALQLQRFQRDAVTGVGNINVAHLPLGVFSRAKYLFTLACAALYDFTAVFYLEQWVW